MPKPAYKSCNPVLLKSLREKRRLTQSALAAAAGYTERLIVKAESGATLSRETIEDLAAALSTPNEQIYPEDLTTDLIQLAQAYLHAIYTYQKDAVSHIRHFLDEDIVFIIPGDPAILPFAGEHRGPDAIHDAFQIFFSILEVPPDHDHRPHYRFLCQGTDVVVWGKSYIRPIGHTMPEPMPISNLLQFRKGKLYCFQDQYDTQLAEKVIRESADRTADV